MAKQLTSVLMHEQYGELLEFPVVHNLEHQVPSPEALVISHMDAGYEGNQEILEKRRVIALLSGMVDNPQKRFNEIAQGHVEGRDAHQQSIENPHLGSVALTAVEA